MASQLMTKERLDRIKRQLQEWETNLPKRRSAPRKEEAHAPEPKKPKPSAS